MKDYHKNKESSYLQFWHENNLNDWVMSQKLSANNFEWIKNTLKLNKDLIKTYNEESDEGYFIDVGVLYLEKLHDKSEYVIHIRNLKQVLNHGLVF